MRSISATVYAISAILNFLFASTTPQTRQITIESDYRWQEASIYKSDKPGYGHTYNTNYSRYTRISAMAWTHSGQPQDRKTLLKFDLNEIPANATIISATLELKVDPLRVGISNDYIGQHGSNTTYLNRITSPWGEKTVTWANAPLIAPGTSSTNRIVINQSNSQTSNISVNIVDMVQHWINNPSQNYGVMFLLQTQTYYRCRTFGGKRHPNSSIRPKLIINYTVPESAVETSIKDIFDGLDKTDITTDVLMDRSINFTGDIDYYTGSSSVLSNDEKTVDIIKSRLMYATLQMGSLGTASGIKPLYEVNEDVSFFSNDGINDIATFSYNYHKLKDNAISSNLISWDGSKLIDQPRSTSPYEQKRFFVSFPTIATGGPIVKFRFPNALYFSNTGEIISRIDVDFGDGNGWVLVNQNQIINIQYNISGRNIIKVKYTYTNGQIEYSRTSINIQGSPGLLVPLGSQKKINSTQNRFASDVDGAFNTFPIPADPGVHDGGLIAYSADFGAVDGVPSGAFDNPLIIVKDYDFDIISGLIDGFNQAIQIDLGIINF